MKYLFFVILVLLVSSSSFAEDVEYIYFIEPSEFNHGQIFISYKGKEFVIEKYEFDWSDLGIL